MNQVTTKVLDNQGSKLVPALGGLLTAPDMTCCLCTQLEGMNGVVCLQETAGLTPQQVESYSSGKNRPEMPFCISLLGYQPRLQSTTLLQTESEDVVPTRDNELKQLLLEGCRFDLAFMHLSLLKQFNLGQHSSRS